MCKAKAAKLCLVLSQYKCFSLKHFSYFNIPMNKDRKCVVYVSYGSFLNTWCERSNDPLNWGWYAVVLYIDILYLWDIRRITLKKFEPWSVNQAFGAVYGLINFSRSVSAISDDVACFNSTATEYLVSRSWIEYVTVTAVGRRQRSHDIHWDLIECGTRCIWRTMGVEFLHGLTFLIGNFDIHV
jgi:hypothetical protein